jgi:hypothetical protein
MKRADRHELAHKVFFTHAADWRAPKNTQEEASEWVELFLITLFDTACLFVQESAARFCCREWNGM